MTGQVDRDTILGALDSVHVEVSGETCRRVAIVLTGWGLILTHLLLEGTVACSSPILL